MFNMAGNLVEKSNKVTEFFKELRCLRDVQTTDALEMSFPPNVMVDENVEFDYRLYLRARHTSFLIISGCNVELLIRLNFNKTS